MRQDNGTAAAPPSADSMAGALEEYLAAAEAGTAPPREEFLARHPELAEELDACLAALRFVGRAAQGPRSVAAEVAEVQPPEQAPGQLGDFRILREVGRGGMGVVYEAEQVSLRRRVALKVLPFAATMGPRHLQRFHNEARAAASLDHPHIVHVHAVGCERAVHYYAMQYIEGQTLAALIADLRRAGGQPNAPEEQATTPHIPGTPGSAPDTAPRAAASTERGPRDRAYFRRVADWGIQAAEALDHAHTLGIVHRDVKPGNLLLDGSGRLWVTDFGLAHMQHAEASLTQPGEMVGTLRYMSPEQALAKRVVVDHRTDVYSLGATLYELLTLEPAFGGQDRQELLRQIAFEEPKWPRGINKAIPGELETIVLKAMAKNPQDRYATAKDLADDLRRWLEDRSIRARRPSWRQVAAKWARRHRAVVWAAAALLVATVLAGGFGVWRLQQRAAAEAEAETALTDAGDLQAQERWPEALFTIGRAEPLLRIGLLGEGLRRRVQQRLEDLRMVDRLEQVRLERAAVKDGHFDLAQGDAAYARAFQDYGIDVRALAAEEAASRLRARSIRVELAAALDDWAFVCRQTRDVGDSTWKELLALARAADPDEVRNRLRDARERGDVQVLKALVAPGMADKLPPSTLVLLGKKLARTGNQEQAVAVLREGQRRHPDNFWFNHELAFTLHELGAAHLEEAVRYYTAAVALRPLSPGAHLGLGLALRKKGRLDEAIAAYREAIRLKKDDAGTHCNLGTALRAQGRFVDALAALKRGHALGSRNPGWPCASAQFVRDCERLVELDGKLPAIRSGQKQPADTAERLAFASLCQQPYKQRYAAATRFYSDAFADKPQLADDLKAQHRYNAACAAAVTGCGQGKDADKLDTKERARLRRQAMDWLRADLKAYRQVLDKSADKAGPAITQRLQHWLQDTDFAGVRGSEALAKLAEAERQPWQKLWEEVEALRQRAATPPGTTTPARPKN